MRINTSSALTAAAAAVGMTVGGLLAPASAAPATSTASALCHYTWGSLPKANSTMTAGPLTNIRAGRHTCFDRIVIDLRGGATGYRVEYVSQVVAPGSGNIVAVRGGAKLQVTINAPAYDSQGRPTYRPANPAEAVNVAGYQSLRQVRWLSSYEGSSTVGVGVRARLPFRVMTLADAGSSRLVIDIAHNW